MSDTIDESRGEGSGVAADARVNGRRYRFDLTSGEILAGPRALVGRYICSEQVADLVSMRESQSHLFIADDPSQLRLVEAEYRLARNKRSKNIVVPHTGQHVTYGTHGVCRVIDVTTQDVTLELLESKPWWSTKEEPRRTTVNVPRARFESEAALAQAPARTEDPYAGLEEGDQPKEVRTEGTVEIDDEAIREALLEPMERMLKEQIDPVLRERMDAIIESKMDALVDRVVERLATTLNDDGKESPGDASVNE